MIGNSLPGRRNAMPRPISLTRPRRAPAAAPTPLLKTGEAVFAKVTDTALVEDRRGPGHYSGRSSGISIPIALGVRYRVGANRGHFVQGTPTPTAIDTGTTYVTNQRVIFQGGKQTRECAFAKLIGFEHDDAEGSTTFSVSNRQRPTRIQYGPSIAGWFEFRLDLGLAHYRGTVASLVAGLQQGLDEIDRHRPLEPNQIASPVVAPSATDPVALKGPGDVADGQRRLVCRSLESIPTSMVGWNCMDGLHPQ